MIKKIQQVSIKGLIHRDGKILVIKTPRTSVKSAKWELPGGRMDFGETVEQTFRREMQEELGFKKVKLGQFINIWSFTRVRDGVDHHFVILDFAAFTDETDIKLSFEHTDYKWVGEKEADKLKMRSGHKKSIKKFFKWI
jgi:8-oxo-dGTP diphosphatase